MKTLDERWRSNHTNQKATIETVVRVVVQIGDGSKEFPHRTIEEFWSPEGKLLYKKDPALEEIFH